MFTFDELFDELHESPAPSMKKMAMIVVALAAVAAFDRIVYGLGPGWCRFEYDLEM